MKGVVVAVGACLVVLIALDLALVTDRHDPAGLATLAGIGGAGAIVAVAKGLAKVVQRPVGRRD